MGIGVQNNLADGGDVRAGVCGGHHDDVFGHNQKEDDEADGSFRGHEIHKHAFGGFCWRNEAVHR
jgi:hypothetical protein